MRDETVSEQGLRPTDGKPDGALAQTEELADTRSLPGSGKPEPQGRWGALELRELLGSGGFGEVWRAWDPRLEREVAVKLLRPRQSPGPETGELQDAVLVEGRALARVRHPNVVAVYGVDRIGSRVGLWMELVHGCTLERLCAEQGPMGAQEAALLGAELCRALAAVHRAGLVHGDVKAQNVMREAGGRVVLMDFGAGSLLRRQEEGGSGSGTKVLSGTPMYMAPELLRGAEATERTDLYSLGVLLYRLVTGGYPVSGLNRHELLEAHEKGLARPLRDARPDLPAAFVRAVERALAADPAQRYASAGQMEQALASTLDLPGAVGTAEGPVAARRRGGWPRLGLAAAALLAASVAAWMLAPGTPLSVEAALYRGGRVPERLESGARVAPGDSLYLELRASEAVHVYLLEADDREEAYLLFPLPGFELANPLPAGERHRLPGEQGGRRMQWQVTSAGGRERFLLVASRRPLPSFERELRRLPLPSEEGAVLAALLSQDMLRGLRTDVTRGVGGLAEETRQTAGAEARRLFEMAQELSQRPDVRQDLWVQQVAIHSGP